MNHLPTADQGRDGLLAMADHYGADTTFRFLRALRSHGTWSTKRAGHVPTKAILSVLAQRIHLANPGPISHLADYLGGYTVKTQPNFYKLVARQLEGEIDDSLIPALGDELPDGGDLYGLLALAARYGDIETFRFLRFLKAQDGGPAGQVVAILAARLVREHMAANPGVEFTEARHAVAMELGYSTSRALQNATNFYDLVQTGMELDSVPTR